MSSTRWEAPAAIFFDRMEATICPGESMDSGRSTEISTSSAGERCAVPPQARQPLCARTISVRRSNGNCTVANTSMVSAVPAGEVMAREEVLGNTSP
ncbi:hypothetical protein D9M68_915040 [compost metagenome]